MVMGNSGYSWGNKVHSIWIGKNVGDHNRVGETEEYKYKRKEEDLYS